jgi:hypothetical protein
MSGCSSKTCATRGCSAGFTAKVTSADGSFPSGMYRIELLVDGTSLTCTFAYPAAMLMQPLCSGFFVAFLPETICTDTRCDAIPGRFFETMTVTGTPGQVHAWQYVDDVPILDAAVAPSYQDERPNGPECEPVCRQASVAWTLLP